MKKFYNDDELSRNHLIFNRTCTGACSGVGGLR